MPSALSGQNDYYARHQRRQSSLSQTSLPDQLRNSLTAPYSPTRSAVLLPATTYGQTAPRPISVEGEEEQRPSSPSLPIMSTADLPSRYEDRTESIHITVDPDEFYRPYQNQYSESTVALRQGVLHPQYDALMQPKFSNGSSHELPTGSGNTPETLEVHNSQTFLPVLRGRKSSVKNIVAQLNASSNEEPPPLPINQISPPASRNISPVIPSSAHLPSYSARKSSVSNESGQQTSRVDGNLVAPSNRHGLGLSTEDLSFTDGQNRRRPLFGEVLQISQSTTAPGFGIHGTRPRSGSEGSPLLGVGPSFARPVEHSRGGANGSGADEDEDATVNVTPRPLHKRRVTSEHSSNNTRSYPASHSAIPASAHAADRSERRKNSISRIPISTRRISASSSSGARSPTSGSSSSETRPATVSTPKRSSARRRQRSPPEIVSPGRRGRSEATHTGAKSPSLRANIIVPLPKISPPLRSSRPRLPVSSASTAASRARMAEKFNEMQKLNNEKRTIPRRPSRPPELTDIDLKARRLRITQALSKSLEGPDLRGGFETKKHRAISSSRTASPALSERSQKTDIEDLPNGVPLVLIDQSATSESERDEFKTPPEEGTPRESQNFTHSALQAMQGAEIVDKDDDDSPTLGRGEPSLSNKPSPLQTNFTHTDHEAEPLSAATNATAETEATIIDPEPQVDFYEPDTSSQSLLSHINRMRHQSSVNFEPPTPSDAASDRADEESVHLILRDTTYLDDSEAIRAGYRKAPTHNESVLQVPPTPRDSRNSWTSSFEDDEVRDDHDDGRTESISARPNNEINAAEVQLLDSRRFEHVHQPSESVRSTMASDAYTIVNIVLQQHSMSGIVDQQFVDDVYERVLQTSPYDTRGSLSTDQIEQLCLRELQNREKNWRKSIIGLRLPSQLQTESAEQTEDVLEQGGAHISTEQATPEHLLNASPLGLPRPPFSSHRYKSSLDSVEDWANTSPSIGDWMQYAVGDEGAVSGSGQKVLLKSHQDLQSSLKFEYAPQSSDDAIVNQSQEETEQPDLYGGSDAQSPPVPPAKDTPFLAQAGFGTALVEPPQVPARLTSLSQHVRQTPVVSDSGAADTSAPAKASIEEPEGPEQRQLKRRRHVIKELVDTEFSYEKDLKVLCDIYKQTASVALSDDDIRVLFGNVEQVQEFSRSFLSSLKSAAKPTYVMERPDRKKEKQTDGVSPRPESSSSTLVNEGEISTAAKDRETYIGKAFESSLQGMERVYADYIRNRHAANQRLAAVQKSSAAREWLKECKDNSSDITNAWNLDALLVKPVQRITKYPLLLRELLEATPKDHPDASFLQRALHEVTEVNVRINDVKKHTELVDQVLNRKRKDSDVRIGISKAFGRRAEKLKQHLGTAEMFEDHQYNEIKISYDNNIVQLMVVGNDCSSYGRAITRWVNKMVEIAAAGESWVDVGPSNHQEAESKLRHFAMVTRGISTIALPDHLEQLEAKVLVPMQTAVDLMNKLKNDPKGLLQKRDKRLIDYAQARNKKDKGEKIDKRLAERMEQWEALNTEAKQRMKKLIRATADLVQACQSNLLQMQMTWLKMVQTKLSGAMGLQLDRIDRENVEKEWQLDFDFQEASALALGICNGSMLAEAVNMVNFSTPSTTLLGEDSPRQPSFTSAQKRSISLHSDGSLAQIADSLQRSSGHYGRQHAENSGDRGQLHSTILQSSRERAISAATVNQSRTPDPSSRNGVTHKHSSTGAAFGGSYLRGEDRNSGSAPKLSVDTPSPLLGSLQAEASNTRPPSSSTFFSAVGDAAPNPRHHSTGSSVFSSAMPMSDSPVAERHPEAPAREPDVLFTAASVYEFNIDRSRQEAGFPYLTYVTGEIFDVIGERGELWLAKNQDDPQRQIGWIWNKHFAKLAG